MADRVISFKGEFDASSILASLKQIRSEMEKGGVDTSLFKGVDKDIAKAGDLITEMMAKIQSGFKDTKEVSAFEKQIGQLEGVFSQIGVGLKNANLPENFKKAAEQIAKMQAHLETSKTELEETRAAAIKFTEAQQASGRYTKAQAEEIKNAVDNEEELLKVVQKVNEEQSKKAQASITRSLTKNASSTQKAAMTTGITSGYSDESTLALAAAEAGIKRLDTYKKMMAEVIMKGTSLKEAFDQLQSEFDQNDKEIMESEEFVKAYTQDLKTLALAAADVGAAEQVEGISKRKGNISKQASTVGNTGAENISGNFVANTSGYDAQIAKIQQVREETRLTEQEIKNTKQTIQGAIEAANTQIDSASGMVQQNTTAWREDAAATKEAVQAQQNIDQTFGNLQNVVKQVLSLSSAWRAFRQVIQQTFNDVQALDKSFAQIAMVTSYSVKDMWDQYGNYAQMANELGQSTQSVIQASGLFYQQGLDTAEALSLTEDTMKLATLANLDFQESTSLMTAALRAFHMGMDEGSHITDVYAELAAHAAADVQGIAYAMSKTASIANSAGMSFENTSAFLTQMIETTQEAPENIGTAMKTIIARFTELKENVAGTADSEFDDLDYNKVDKALKSVGVSLKDAQGQFRNLDDVFLELSEKWDTLDRNSQRYIATIAAGSRQQSRFIAMMENYDRTLELIETAQDSTGKSSEQFAKYQDTVEYKINQLKNSWEQLRTSFLDSDMYKGAIDGLTNIVDKISQLDVGKLIAMSPIIITVVKNFVQTFVSGIQSSAQNFQAAGKAIGQKVADGVSSIAGKISSKVIISPEIQKQKAEKEAKELQKKLDKILKQKNEIQVSTEKARKEFDATKKKAEELKKAIDAIRNNTADMSQGELVAGIGGYDDASSDEAIEAAEKQLAEYDQQIEQHREKLQQLALDTENNANAEDEMTAAIERNKQAQVDADKQTEKYKEQQKQLAQTTTQAINTIGQSVTIFATTLLAGGTLEDALKAMSTMMLTQFIQMGVQLATQFIAMKITTAAGWAGLTTENAAGAAASGAAVGEGLNAGLASTGIGLIIVAIGAAIGALFAGISALVSHYKETHQTIEQQLEEAQEKQKELEQAAAEADSEVKSKKESLEHTKAIKKEFEELSKVYNKTDEQQARYNELVGEIRDQFPELISYYNEATNEVRLQADMWDSVLDKQTKALELAENQALTTKMQATNNAAVINNLEHARDSEDIIGNFTAERVFNTGNLDKTIESLEDMKTSLSEVKQKDISGNVYYDWYNMRGDLDWDQMYNRLGIDPESTTAYEDFKKIQEENWEKVESVIKDGIDETIDALKNEDEAYRKEMAKNYAEYYAAINPDATTTEIKVTELLGERALSQAGENIQAISASSYSKNNDGYYSFFNALGGANAGASNNSFSNWEDLEKSNATIKGLTEYGIEKATDVLDLLVDSMGQNAAEEFWAKNQGDTAGQKKIFDAAIAEAVKQKIDQYVEDNSLSPEAYNKVEASYTKLMDDGVSTSELEDFKLTISSLNIDQTLKDQLYDEMAGEAEEALQTAITAATEAGLSEADIENWTDTQMNAFANYIEGISEEVGEETAKVFGKTTQDLATAYGLSTDEMLNVMNSVDWTNASLSNLDDFKEQSIDTIMEITGFNEEQAAEFFDKWSKEAEKATLLDITINNSRELDDYLDKIHEIQDTAKKQKDTVIDIVASQEINGEIDVDQYDKMVESLTEMGVKAKDINEYLHVDKDGKIVADAEKIKALYNDQAYGAAEKLKAAKQQSIENLNELKSRKSILETDLKDLDVRLAMLKASSVYDSGALKAYNELADQYDDIAKKTQLNLDAVNQEIQEQEEVINNYDELIAQEENLSTARQKNFEDELTKKREDLKDVTNDLTKAEEDLASAEEKVADKQKAVTEAHDKVLDALDDIAEAEQNIIDKTNELNEALYGTENHKNKLDPLYNYTTKLERLQKATDDAKDALDNIQPGDDIDALMGDYLNNSRKETIARTAENQVMQSSIDNYKTNLDSKLGEKMAKLNEKYGANIDVNMADFYYKDGDRWAINFEALNAANIPDEISDYVEETVEQMNQLEDNIEKNEEEIKKREKELREIRKKGVEAQVSLENEVAQVLKDKYQEEIDNLKDKYDSMEDADNEYLDALEDAINKQRELRDRQNQWEDLAQKEKKLSLMERDTSGTNKVETQKLQKEVKSNREKLLDNSIDQIIKGLKEIYDTQAENREAEVEYKQTVLDNTNLIAEANTIISSWESAEDAISFFYENVKGISEMSEAQLEQETESWKDMYEAHEVYLQTNSDHFEQTLQDYENKTIATEDKVQDVITDTSEVLISETQRSLDEITTKTDESIDKAKTALEDAMENLTQKQKAYNDAIEAEASALESLRQAQIALNEARGKYDDAAAAAADKGGTGDSKEPSSTLGNAISTATSFVDVFARGVKEANTIKDNWKENEKIENYDDQSTKEAIKKSGKHGVVAKDGTIKAVTNSFEDSQKWIMGQPPEKRGGLTAYAEGGLVNFTGPAWVDGTPNKPEAFLDSEDTERIGKAANILSTISNLLNMDLEQGKTDYVNNNDNSTINGDTVINVTVNVENISDDYDVDSAIERVKKDITDAANYAGSNVILRK